MQASEARRGAGNATVLAVRDATLRRSATKQSGRRYGPPPRTNIWFPVGPYTPEDRARVYDRHGGYRHVVTFGPDGRSYAALTGRQMRRYRKKAYRYAGEVTR